MLNVFIPHRWHGEDYEEISRLLDRTKYRVRDYSVPKEKALEKIDSRYKVDPQIQRKIIFSSVVVCSNRPALNNGMAIDEIGFAVEQGKPVVALRFTDNKSQMLTDLGVEDIPKRRASLEKWIDEHCS